MKISYNWLKWYIPEIPEANLPNANKLRDTLTYHLTEVEGVYIHDHKHRSLQSIPDPYYNDYDPDIDYILDVNILPNRAHDLLSHSGVARELSGQLGILFIDPAKTYTDIIAKKEIQKTNLSIDVRTENCRRFTARIIRNIKVGPSPEWVVKHLESIGSRTINNIVDATNLVMFNCGQPTHAFDLRKFADEKVVVSNAKDDEELKLVGRDGIVAKLKSNDIIISNNDNETLSLAGIKGGVNSGVSLDTTDLLLEVANFNPTNIRKTARRIGVLSDSAKRFENDLSPELCTFAMLELTALICEMCPDAIVEEVVGYYPNPQKEKTISFTTDFVNKKVGGSIKDEDIEKILKNYNFEYKNNNGSFEVTIPALRLDLENPTDMAEEIGRIYGYDKLTPSMPKISFEPKQNETYQKILAIRNHLLSDSYREVMTYAFGKKGEVEVLASASDKNFLRTNLREGILDSLTKNFYNADFLGLSEIKIFETGKVFTEDSETNKLCIGIATTKKGKLDRLEFEIAGEIEKLINNFHSRIEWEPLVNKQKLKGSIFYNDTKIGIVDVNTCHSLLIEIGRKTEATYPIGILEIDLDLIHLNLNCGTVYSSAKTNQIFKIWSIYPFITRDLSLWVNNDNDKDIVIEIIKNAGKDLLVKEPQILDRFEKEGKISFAFRMVFQSQERTLSDIEINQIMDQINQKVVEKSYIPR